MRAPEGTPEPHLTISERLKRLDGMEITLKLTITPAPKKGTEPEEVTEALKEAIAELTWYVETGEDDTEYTIEAMQEM